ncbi:MAG TPA: polysaccharide biosynthesis/export family protein [Sphingomicrobium sp.]|nr:polysaccharide biosynthesis/export family protein [Sphingomicrobium sp.]
MPTGSRRRQACLAGARSCVYMCAKCSTEVGNLIVINVLARHSREEKQGVISAGRSLLGVVAATAPLLAGCVSTSVGPSRALVENAAEAGLAYPGVKILPLTNSLADARSATPADGDFLVRFGAVPPIGSQVGVGDALEVTIWEAAPAALFGSATIDTRSLTTVQTSRPNALPEIVVGPSGTITIPFAGQIRAAGRTLRQIEQDIVASLRGRAHLPQAIVRIARNETANVTVLGDVKEPQRVPLTPRGERLLDVIARAGGTSQPLDRMTIELTRGNVTQRMAARDIVRDPRQNIILQRDDVVTAAFQPYTFTVLGAAGKNEEVRFEGVGLTLSQALGRIGGFQDDRADPRGVFLFRWEPPSLAGADASQFSTNPEGKVPVIYQVDMKEPQTYFAAQKFQMRDGDIVYVANSKLADLQRFVNILASSIIPLATVRNTVR